MTRKYEKHWEMLKAKGKITLEVKSKIHSSAKLQSEMQKLRAGISKEKHRDVAFRNRNPDKVIDFKTTSHRNSDVAKDAQGVSYGVVYWLTISLVSSSEISGGVEIDIT